MIAEKIKKNLGQLSTVNLDFLEFVENNPESIIHSNYKLLDLHHELFVLQPWPTFIKPSVRKDFQSATVELYRLNNSIPRRVFGHDLKAMGKYYEIPLNLVTLQMEGVDDRHLENLLARGDFILSSTGLKCLEYNVAASLGGWQIPMWEHLYLNHPIISRFIKEYGITTRNENLFSIFLDHVVHATLSRLPDGEHELNHAVVMKGTVDGAPDTVGVYLNKLNKDVLHRLEKPLHGDVILCDYHHLHTRGDELYYKEKKIRALTEMSVGLVSPDVMKAFKAGNITLFNGPVTDLLSSKLNLALLSDYNITGVWTEDEKRIIDTYVPWTRKVAPGRTSYGRGTVDLEDFVFSNRERLVLKPSVGYGGKQVAVGLKMNPGEWEEIAARAFKERNWAVQEYAGSQQGMYQMGDRGYGAHDVVWGFFICGSRYAGAWARVMPWEKNKGVINCHQGATVSVVFDVDK